MLAFMIYVILVGAVLGAAAWLAEKSADQGRGSSRWLWSLAILASLIVPLAMTFVSIRTPGQRPPAPAAVPLRQMTGQLLEPAQWVTTAGRALPRPIDLDRILTTGWTAASALLLLGVLVQAILLHRAKKTWRNAKIAGVEVLVSDTVGPALVGLIKPRIVVPAWVETSPAETQALIIAHERTHLDADDALLLAIAILLIVCMPWNLPLWWQLHRLRYAIEADCDARVLRGGGEPESYGRTLLMVAERHVSGLAVVAAMSEPKSNLERRLRKMLKQPKQAAWAAATALAALSLTVAAAAGEVSPPVTAASIREIKLDAKTLDAYVGAYVIGGRAVLDVTRKGDQLMAQVSDQPSLPVYPSAKGEFFYKVVGARLSFRPNEVTLHQGGADLILPLVSAQAADKLRASLAARQKAQIAAPGTDAAIHALVASTEKGAADYGLMTPEIAKAARLQEKSTEAFMKKMGKVEDIRFQGVGPMGVDVYRVRHENGLSRWMIALNAQGKIDFAAVTPGP